jgi:hypothetical protein
MTSCIHKMCEWTYGQTNPPISTKRTTTADLKLFNTKGARPMTLEIEVLSLESRKKYLLLSFMNGKFTMEKLKSSLLL